MKFMNRKFGWLILSLIVFSFQATAQEKDFDDSVLSEKGKLAYKTLLSIELFAIGGIGYDGKTSEGEKVFDILLDEKEAISAFKSLVKNATIEGGMYGLFGLKITGCNCFREEFINFKNLKAAKENEEAITIQSGCTRIEAQTSSEKVFILENVVGKSFDQMANWKKSVRRQRTVSEEQKQSNNAINKNQ
jgi:hypothetical protein